MHYPPVLVVEDNATTREVLKARFQNKSIPCVEASDGFTAMRLLKQQSFSLVLLDIVMPGMDGLELLRWMTINGIKTPVVAMSGSLVCSGINYAHMAQELGAFWGISKPVSDDDIAEMESLRVPVMQSGLSAAG
ncbi:MAG: response regulator [Pseudomonadota bacterium]|nr:response regulator [Pseudomonadota bacterium]